MKWHERVVLWLIVFVLGVGIHIDLLQGDRLADIRVKARQEFARVTDHNYEVDNRLLRHRARLDDLAQILNLSVLDSCGIITNGYGHGSCVAIGPDLLLTAGHCIGQDGSWIEIQGVRYEIVEQWISENYDVGFVRIEGVLSYVELGQMPDLLDTVYLTGAPYEPMYVNTITRGIISYLGRDKDCCDLHKNLIQTDAEGAPGSSGCPLFDVSGQIIGICVSGPAPGGGVVLCVSVMDIRAALEEYDAR